MRRLWRGGALVGDDARGCFRSRRFIRKWREIREGNNKHRDANQNRGSRMRGKHEYNSGGRNPGNAPEAPASRGLNYTFLGGGCYMSYLRWLRSYGYNRVRRPLGQTH